MSTITLLVLADPADPTLRMLAELSDSTSIACGNSVEAFRSLAERADVILNWSGSRELLEQVWAMAPRVRWLHSRSAGLEDLLFPALEESDVPLTNARGIFSRPLGEFAIAAILFFAKDLRRMVRSQTAGVWDQFDVEEIHGKTMGIVGYGDIGRVCAERARAFGMKIVALRRRPELSREDPVVEKAFPPERKRDLLAISDYVIISAPLTSATRGMIGEDEFRVMKKSAVLINVGRGPVVEETALVRALQEGWIRGAALDVFDREPLPDGHPFYRLENLLLSPHCADHTPDWLERAMRFFLENFERFRAGKPLWNVVDKKSGY
jgi:phosphoglycerate dehydrogenase-like enzyme